MCVNESQVGLTVFDRVLLSAVLVLTAIPGPGSIVAGIVSAPAPVESGSLASSPSYIGTDGPDAPGRATPTGSETLQIEIAGRLLSLSLVRAGSTGLAVLSTPPRSTLSSLPSIAPSDFQDLAAEKSGCSAIGEVQVMSSRRGTVALATGLTCS